MESESIISLVTNFNLIYLTLIGMTDLAHKNNIASVSVRDYFDIGDDVKRLSLEVKQHVTVASKF